MQDNNENNNVNMVTESVQETVNQNVESVPVNTVEESNVSKKKNNKKIIIMIAIIILVVVIGVLAFFIFTKDDKSNKPIDNNQANSTNNNSNEENDKDDENNESVVLANVKATEGFDGIKEKKYFIYKSSDSIGSSYYILPEKNNEPYEGDKLTSTYTCKDECVFKNYYFMHEDNSYEYFDENTGKVIAMKFDKKYETISDDLKIEKYTAGDNIIFYGEYKGDKNFNVVYDDKEIEISFDGYDLLFGSNLDTIEKGTYVLAKMDENYYYYEIYNNKTKRGLYKRVSDEDDTCISVNLEENDYNYKIGTVVIGGERYFILNSKLEKIIEYYDWNSDCAYGNGAYYCFKNDFDLETENKRKSTVSKYGENGKETLIRNYANVVDISPDLKVMGLTSENKFEVFDLLNNKVLYTFDVLTSTQTQVYGSYFRYSSYFDTKSNKFYAFVDDEKLSIKDFPNASEDNENHFGYYYTYDVKTNKASIEKKAIFISQE